MNMPTNRMAILALCPRTMEVTDAERANYHEVFLEQNNAPPPEGKNDRRKEIPRFSVHFVTSWQNGKDTHSTAPKARTTDGDEMCDYLPLWCSVAGGRKRGARRVPTGKTASTRRSLPHHARRIKPWVPTWP